MTIARDITERKQLEESLRANERRYRLLAEHVTDVIWTMDLSGRFTYMSPSVEQMLGFKWQDGVPLTLADIVAPKSLGRVLEMLETSIAEAADGRRPYRRMELELLRRDGSSLWVEIAAGGLYGESGEMVGGVGVTRDISERKRAEAQLQKYAVELEATNKTLEKSNDLAECANRAKGEFLANMSHELRTPMTAVLGYADLLRDPTVDDSTRHDYLDVIQRNGKHLLTLIDDILDLSKIEAGKLSLDRGRASVIRLLTDVAGLLRHRAEQRGIALTVERRTRLPETILTDELRLRQVLINLVGNAVKFTEEGSVRIVVSWLPEWNHGPAIRFEVVDTGIGIPAETLPRLFQPFPRAISPSAGNSVGRASAWPSRAILSICSTASWT